MPPKKKKGKGRKEAQTEEQKRKIADQKALAEKEKLARRQQLTNAFLKLKRDKEYEIIKLNENKLLDLWRPRLRKMKIAELMEDYKLMQHAFERAYDKKQNLLENLGEILKRNEGEYDRAVDMHMHNIDKMMEFYRERMKEVKESYLDERQKLLDILYEERKQIEDSHSATLKDLRSQMDEEINHHKELSIDSKQELYIREEELRNKSMEEAHALKMVMEARMNDIWSDIQQRLIAYEMTSSQKRQEYIGYKQRDEQMSALIDSQFRKLYALREGICHLEKKKRMFNTAMEEFMGQLRAKRSEYFSSYNGNINCHKRTMQSNQGAIRHLVLASRAAIEKVDAMLKQRELVMMILERCRRGERLEERLHPFVLRFGECNLIEVQKDGQMSVRVNEEDIGQRSPPPPINSINEDGLVCDEEEKDPCKCHGGTVVASSPLNKILNEFGVLDKFWIRFNRVSLEKATLRAKREELARDNFNLRLAIRNYMGGVNPANLDVNFYSNQYAEKEHDKIKRMDQVNSINDKIKQTRRGVIFVPSREYDCNLICD